MNNLVMIPLLFKGILEWVMDSKQKDQQQIQERVLMLQKEKEQVSCNKINLKCSSTPYLISYITVYILCKFSASQSNTLQYKT